ncbi:MAG: AmmeMemoRadiSam system protein B [Deltaproteobacteria bacterium]|nr:AmmeMemoRadiSam system protein B [Deltaproteobacteria bacterium]
MAGTALRRGAPRPSALAGRWYPGDARALGQSVRDYVADAGEREVGGVVRAVIAPHAGHVYSGPIAGVAFAALAEGPRFRRVVLVGPAHRVAFQGISAGDFARYELPTGEVTVDREAIAALEAAGLVGCVPEAHAEEHCLEIELPFVLETLGDVPIVPLLVGRATGEQVARALAATLRDDDLLLVSSDLSHYQPYDEARAQDLTTLAAIAAGRGEELDGHDACGYRGIQGALQVARSRGWRPEVLDYRSSGDTAGDKRAVVGYGAVAIVA